MHKMITSAPLDQRCFLTLFILHKYALRIECGPIFTQVDDMCSITKHSNAKDHPSI